MPSYQFVNLPNPWPFYLKAICKSKPGFRDGDKLPTIQVSWSSFRFNQEMVQKYAALCNLTLQGDRVPLLFPHSLLGPFHLAMLTDASFPLKVLGGVHLRNHLIQHEPLVLNKEYRADLTMDTARRRPQGLEIDFKTEIRHGQTMVWESLTTFLFRRKFKEEDQPGTLADKVENLTNSKKVGGFAVPANIGKQFGLLTKDINPIHMSRLLAKLFGFKRDLCHGMWALGRTLGTMEHIDYSQPVRNDVAFKGPLYIEHDIAIQVAPDDASRFELYSGKNERPCIVSRIQNVPAGSRLAD